MVDAIGSGKHVQLARSAHEAEPAASHGLDQSLFGTTVADGPTGGAHPARDRLVRDDPAVPDDLDQFVLADDAVPVPDEVGQDVEDLRFNVRGFAKAMQLTPVAIELAVREGEGHSPAPHYS